MSTPLDIVEQDLQAVRASLKAAFAWLATHPNYGSSDAADGEMLCDIGTILLDSSNRLEGIHDKLDSNRVEVMA